MSHRVQHPHNAVPKLYNFCQETPRRVTVSHLVKLVLGGIEFAEVRLDFDIEHASCCEEFGERRRASVRTEVGYQAGDVEN